jgi:hypothetical protein
MQTLKDVRPEQMREVLRLAAELYAQDRAAIERAKECDHVQTAAAEAGLPPEYLERAASQLQAHRDATTRRRGRHVRPEARLALVVVGIGVFLGPRTLVKPPSAPSLAPSPIRNNLAFATLPGSSFAGQNLSNSDLQGTNLSGANLRRANLSRCNLYGAILSRADLWQANLKNANLQSVDLSGANLAGADLTGTDLAGANLRSANLIGTLISGTNFQGADLTGATYDAPLDR